MHMVGFMGSGKSTVGQLLARRLVWNYLDLDAMVVRHVGKPIAAIFADDGEAEFRRQESWVLEQVVHKPHTVVALGGGTITDPENHRLCDRVAATVWLRCPLEVLRGRLGDTSADRPLWLEKISLEALFEARQETYRKARYVVDARAPAARVAADIEDLLLAAGDC